jgi:hypothetical protein
MTDEFTKARVAREARKRFGNSERLGQIVDEGVADLWNGCAACWESDDDVKDRAILGAILARLITYAQGHHIRDEEIIEELDAARSGIAEAQKDEQ